MTGEKIKIEKSKLPKVRRKWSIKPTTKIKDSKKKYDRGKVKRNSRKAVNNAKD